MNAVGLFHWFASIVDWARGEHTPDLAPGPAPSRVPRRRSGAPERSGGARSDARRADSLTERGLERARAGAVDDARQLLEEALELHASDSARVPEFVVTANRLARMHIEQGNAADARVLLERALARHAGSGRDDDVKIAGTLFNLGLVLMTQAEFPAATTALARALAIEEARLGAEHPELVSTLVGYAGCRELLGETGTAIALLERAVRILDGVPADPEHDLPGVLVPLARAYLKHGEAQKAKKPLLRLLDLHTRELGPEHPDLLVTLNNLAHVAEAAGNLIEARHWRERALALGDAAWGGSDPRIAPTLEALGTLLWAAEEWRPCRAINERLFRIWVRELGPDHPACAVKLQDLAVLATRTGEAEQAEGLFEQALDVLDRVPSNQRPAVQRIVTNLERLVALGAGERFGELLDRARFLERRMAVAPPMPEA